MNEPDPKLAQRMVQLAMTAGASFAKTRGFELPPDDKIDEIAGAVGDRVLEILRRDQNDPAVSDGELATRCCAVGVTETAKVLGLTPPEQLN